MEWKRVVGLTEVLIWDKFVCFLASSSKSDSTSQSNDFICLEKVANIEVCAFLEKILHISEDCLQE